MSSALTVSFVSTGTLFRASQFLAEELPIRLAHRVKELTELPDGLSDMPSITRVKDWYAQSFEELTEMQRPSVSNEVRERLLKPSRNSRGSKFVDEPTQNPAMASNGNGNGKHAMGGARRYFAGTDDGAEWPRELNDYNKKFRNVLDKIKRRHDGVVTTVGEFNCSMLLRFIKMRFDISRHPKHAKLINFFCSSRYQRVQKEAATDAN